jgi:hypothetical protein
MSFLKSGVKATAKAIKKHKLMFIGAIIVQILLVIVLTYTSLNYQLKIMEGAQNVVEPLQDANYDQESLEAGQPFTKDILQIYTGYKEMMKNITEYILWLSGIFLLVNGLIWIMVYKMFGKKGILNMLGKYIGSSIMLMVPFFIVCYYILKGFLSLDIATESFALVIQMVSVLFLVLYYFLLIGFSQLYIKSWKKFFKAYWSLGIKKIVYAVPVLIINSCFIFLGGYLIYLTAMNEVSLWVMILAAIFLVLIFVIGKIFWIASLNSVKK